MAKSNVATIHQEAPLTPMQVLHMAVDKGAGVDQLAKLMDLQERHEANEARKAFVAALNAFKANPPRIFKDKEIKHSGRKVSDYASLNAVCDAIVPALSKHGLSHNWDVEQTETTIKVACILTHAMGHSERVAMQSPADVSGSKNAIQAIGSAVTYLERYTLLAATGLAAEETDDDANGMWQGPLNRTALKKDARALAHALSQCSNLEDLAVLEEANGPMLDQLKVDMPLWWHGDGNDIKGASVAIEETRERLESYA